MTAFALLRGLGTFREDVQRLIVARAATTAKRLAAVDRDVANWPVFGAAGARALVQWCHGAPGFLLTLAARLPKTQDEELERLFLQAGELVWRAGPLTKGACYCHGTDGNAMALLTLHTRTGEQLWLDPDRFELPERNDPGHPHWQEDDLAFKQAYEHGDWADEVAGRFGLWLNGQLRKRSDKLALLGEAEMRHFARQAILDVAWPIPLQRRAKAGVA